MEGKESLFEIMRRSSLSLSLLVSSEQASLNSIPSFSMPCSCS